jgi:uncharacterized membrane protein YeaQ/YmgE (transglycosylase-associated protein family)
MEIFADILAAPFICIGWIIVGALAGALAHTLMGDTDQPLMMDVILGLIGSMIGGFVVGLLGIYTPENGLMGVLASLVVATIGAVILIAIMRAFRGRRVA